MHGPDEVPYLAFIRLLEAVTMGLEEALWGTNPCEFAPWDKNISPSCASIVEIAEPEAGGSHEDDLNQG